MFKSRIETKLDEEIIFSLKELVTARDNPDEYTAIVDRIVKLEKLKSEPGWKPPSIDTVLIVGANIFGILWLARYERENVVRSPTALKFVMKPR